MTLGVPTDSTILLFYAPSFVNLSHEWCWKKLLEQSMWSEDDRWKSAVHTSDTSQPFTLSMIQLCRALWEILNVVTCLKGIIIKKCSWEVFWFWQEYYNNKGHLRRNANRQMVSSVPYEFSCIVMSWVWMISHTDLDLAVTIWPFFNLRISLDNVRCKEQSWHSPLCEGRS